MARLAEDKRLKQKELEKKLKQKIKEKQIIDEKIYEKEQKDMTKSFIFWGSLLAITTLSCILFCFRYKDLNANARR